MKSESPPQRAVYVHPDPASFGKQSHRGICECGCERMEHTLRCLKGGVYVGSRCLRHSKMLGKPPAERCLRYKEVGIRV